jgi:hypothetical protein
MTLWLWGEQALAFEQFPEKGAGSEVRVQVFQMAGPGNAVQVAMLSDGMRVASIGKQLHRSPAARLKGANRHALTECCVIRCEAPYGLWTTAVRLGIGDT